MSDWVTGIEQQIQKFGHMTDCIWVKSPSPADILVLPEGNDMQNYLKKAAKSFTLMKNLPVFTIRYRRIMVSQSLL